MSNHISLIQQPRQGLSQKQSQRLIMSDHMQQALNILQMPLQELAISLQNEIEQNPIIEYAADQELDDFDLIEETLELNLNIEEGEKPLKFDDKDFEILRRMSDDFRDHFAESRNPAMLKCASDHENKGNYLENTIINRVSLFEHLMNQARETLETEEDLNIAETLIGNLDESGYLSTPINEIAILAHTTPDKADAILKQIQTFEPYGVGAKNLQECLLIQLRCLGLSKTLAYKIVSEQYDNLIHNKIPDIKRKLKCNEKQLQKAIYSDIAKLDFHPGSSFAQVFSMPIIPDITIEDREGELTVICNDEEFLPNIRLNKDYLKFLTETENSEEREFIRQRLLTVKWLLRNIYHRGATLQRIAYSLLRHHNEFFNGPDGKLVPLTMSALAEELDLHESTIARAVSNKYIYTPRGLFPLRYFFTNAINSQEGDLSSNTVRDLILEIINKENKKAPLSDQQITKLLKDKGIDCARRTVAKYRTQLKIGNAHQRKLF